MKQEIEIACTWNILKQDAALFKVSKQLDAKQFEKKKMTERDKIWNK